MARGRKPGMTPSPLSAIFAEIERLAAAGFHGQVTIHFKDGEPSSVEKKQVAGARQGWRFTVEAAREP